MRKSGEETGEQKISGGNREYPNGSESIKHRINNWKIELNK